MKGAQRKCPFFVLVHLSCTSPSSSYIFSFLINGENKNQDFIFWTRFRTLPCPGSFLAVRFIQHDQTLWRQSVHRVIRHLPLIPDAILRHSLARALTLRTCKTLVHFLPSSPTILITHFKRFCVVPQDVPPVVEPIIYLTLFPGSWRIQSRFHHYFCNLLHCSSGMLSAHYLLSPHTRI